MFLCYHLVAQFCFTTTNADNCVANLIGKSERSVRRWRSSLIENKGWLPGSKQGKFQRTGVLWRNEELNEKASTFVRANSAVKGEPNMTTLDFCKWVNNTLLPSSTLEPGFPRNVSVETARLWLHNLGFEVLTPRKGISIDGHERPDVVAYRKVFLRNLMKIGFLQREYFSKQ